MPDYLPQAQLSSESKNRQQTEEAGLDSLTGVVEICFESIPFPPNSFEIVWSQDVILHSGDRKKVMEAVHPVLKPCNVFIFTDPMQSDESLKMMPLPRC